MKLSNVHNLTWPVGIRVYLYSDAEGRPLYVGQTGDMLERHRTHGRLRSWFPLAAACEVLSLHAERADAVAAERQAIRDLQPAFNIHHNPARSVA